MAAAKSAGEGPARDAAADAIDAAVEHVRAGGLLAFATETVWGLGADACSEAALERLRRWKGRDAGQPVSVLIADAGSARALGIALDGAARRLAAAFWPGPLTLVVPAPAGRFAAGIARADGAVGLRCSSHPRAAALVAALARAGVGPLTATSLNRHGEPPVRTRTEALALCRGDDAPRCFELEESAGDAPAGSVAERAAPGPTAPSTVVDCTGPRPVVLRPGALAPATLARALGERVLCERWPDAAGRPDEPSPDPERPAP
jgi:L-threonylcarbamoyladenylate synthase